MQWTPPPISEASITILVTDTNCWVRYIVISRQTSPVRDHQSYTVNDRFFVPQDYENGEIYEKGIFYRRLGVGISRRFGN